MAAEDPRIRFQAVAERLKRVHLRYSRLQAYRRRIETAYRIHEILRGARIPEPLRSEFALATDSVTYTQRYYSAIREYDNPPSPPRVSLDLISRAVYAIVRAVAGRGDPEGLAAAAGAYGVYVKPDNVYLDGAVVYRDVAPGRVWSDPIWGDLLLPHDIRAAGRTIAWANHNDPRYGAVIAFQPAGRLATISVVESCASESSVSDLENLVATVLLRVAEVYDSAGDIVNKLIKPAEIAFPPLGAAKRLVANDVVLPALFYGIASELGCQVVTLNVRFMTPCGYAVLYDNSVRRLRPLLGGVIAEPADYVPACQFGEG